MTRSLLSIALLWLALAVPLAVAAYFAKSFAGAGQRDLAVQQAAKFETDSLKTAKALARMIPPPRLRADEVIE